MMYFISKKKKKIQLSFQTECHLAKSHALPYEVSAFIYNIYIYIYILIDWFNGYHFSFKRSMIILIKMTDFTTNNEFKMTMLENLEPVW